MRHPEFSGATLKSLDPKSLKNVYLSHCLLKSYFWRFFQSCAFPELSHKIMVFSPFFLSPLLSFYFFAPLLYPSFSLFFLLYLSPFFLPPLLPRPLKSIFCLLNQFPKQSISRCRILEGRFSEILFKKCFLLYFG